MAAVLFAMSLFRQGVETPAQADDTNLLSFVRSMDGTQPDGDLRSDGDVLVVDTGLRLLFEYYLAAVGEASLDEIRGEIEREIDKRLKPAPAAEAKRLLGCYFEYKRALVEVEESMRAQGNSLEDMRARMAAMRQTRERFFSPKEVQGMFGDEDAYNTDALVRLETLQDPSLSEVQKREKLAALDAALAPEMRDAREAPLRILKLEAAVSKLREQGASESEVYRMRAAALGAEAADRLAELDRELSNKAKRPNADHL